MAYIDLFQPKTQIDEAEVFNLTGKIQKAYELNPSKFEGPVAEWANFREQQFGERILARTVYVENLKNNPHHVAWVKHEGIDENDGEPYCYHHLVCDCSLEAEKIGAPELIFGCQALISAVLKRSWIVGQTLKTEKILDTINELPDEALFGISRKAAQIHVGVKTLTTILEHDVRHPEDWVGNAVQYRHEIPSLKITMGYSEEDVVRCAEYLEGNGVATIDQNSISLTEETISDILDDKKQRESFEVAFRSIQQAYEEQ